MSSATFNLLYYFFLKHLGLKLKHHVDTGHWHRRAVDPTESTSAPELMDRTLQVAADHNNQECISPSG